MPQRPLPVSVRRRPLCRRRFWSHLKEKGGFEGSLENGSFPFGAGSRAVRLRSRLWERPSLVSNARCDASHGVFSSYELWFQKYLKKHYVETWKLSTSPRRKKIKESMEHVPRSKGDPSELLKWRRLSLDLEISGAVMQSCVNRREMSDEIGETTPEQGKVKNKYNQHALNVENRGSGIPPNLRGGGKSLKSPQPSNFPPSEPRLDIEGAEQRVLGFDVSWTPVRRFAVLNRFEEGARIGSFFVTRGAFSGSTPSKTDY